MIILTEVHPDFDIIKYNHLSEFNDCFKKYNGIVLIDNNFVYEYEKYDNHYIRKVYFNGLLDCYSVYCYERYNNDIVIRCYPDGHYVMIYKK